MRRLYPASPAKPHGSIREPSSKFISVEVHLLDLELLSWSKLEITASASTHLQKPLRMPVGSAAISKALAPLKARSFLCLSLWATCRQMHIHFLICAVSSTTAHANLLYRSKCQTDLIPHGLYMSVMNQIWQYLNNWLSKVSEIPGMKWDDLFGSLKLCHKNVFATGFLMRKTWGIKTVAPTKGGL